MNSIAHAFAGKQFNGKTISPDLTKLVAKKVQKKNQLERALSAAKANRVKLVNLKAAGKLKARQDKALKEANAKVNGLQSRLYKVTKTLNNIKVEA